MSKNAKSGCRKPKFYLLQAISREPSPREPPPKAPVTRVLSGGGRSFGSFPLPPFFPLQCFSSFRCVFYFCCVFLGLTCDIAACDSPLIFCTHASNQEAAHAMIFLFTNYCANRSGTWLARVRKSFGVFGAKLERIIRASMLDLKYCAPTCSVADLSVHLLRN